jgi:hypothetical protein
MALSSPRDPQPGRAEHRTSRHYPVNAEVEFRLISTAQVGTYRRGRIVKLSTTDLMLECDSLLQTGLEIELMIKWPARRGRGKEILVHLVGRIVRTKGSYAAVRIDQINFQYPPPGANWASQ